MITERLVSPRRPTAHALSARYPAPRELRFAGRDPLPSREACALLAGDGVARIILSDPLDLADPRCLDAVRLIRDCVAVGITVDWHVTSTGAVDPATLMHLSPPAQLPGYDALLESWSDFAFGVLYWRSGPQFAVIRDVRPAFEPAWYELDEAASLELFVRLAEPQAVAACERFGDAFSDLRTAQLVLTIGAACVALPYRIHKWPVPFLSV